MCAGPSSLFAMSNLCVVLGRKMTNNNNLNNMQRSHHGPDNYHGRLQRIDQVGMNEHEGGNGRGLHEWTPVQPLSRAGVGFDSRHSGDDSQSESSHITSSRDDASSVCSGDTTATDFTEVPDDHAIAGQVLQQGPPGGNNNVNQRVQETIQELQSLKRQSPGFSQLDDGSFDYLPASTRGGFGQGPSLPIIQM
jgi:hypothetical protein